MKRNTRILSLILCAALLLGLFASAPGAILSNVSAVEKDAVIAEKNLLADYNPSFEDIAIPNWTITPGTVQSSEKAADEWSLKISVKDAYNDVVIAMMRYGDSVAAL